MAAPNLASLPPCWVQTPPPLPSRPFPPGLKTAQAQMFRLSVNVRHKKKRGAGLGWGRTTGLLGDTALALQTHPQEEVQACAHRKTL